MGYAKPRLLRLAGTFAVFAVVISVEGPAHLVRALGGLGISRFAEVSR